MEFLFQHTHTHISYCYLEHRKCLWLVHTMAHFLVYFPCLRYQIESPRIELMWKISDKKKRTLDLSFYLENTILSPDFRVNEWMEWGEKSFFFALIIAFRGCAKHIFSTPRAKIKQWQKTNNEKCSVKLYKTNRFIAASRLLNCSHFLLSFFFDVTEEKKCCM